jgi:Xaa-Pro aminopeptidase
MHESPFLDRGDHTVIEPGMVLTVEPGIYLPGVAGFRHSDTVLVTDTGHELLTTYPRDLDALTIAV